jgi:hypothetical protein
MIKGSIDEVDKFVNSVSDAASSISFEKILPCPQALRNESAPNREEQSIAFNTSKYGAKDWYDWCNKNWGTKWDAQNPYRRKAVTEGDSAEVKYEFQTAWAPPIPVYKAMAEMFPNINIYITYDEPGMEFSGWVYYKNGKLQSEKEYNFSYDSLRAYMDPSSDVWEYFE